MPFSLTDSDVAILKGLLKDGDMSRETGISTPTVKARFDRHVNIGFIKSVSPILDFKKVDYNDNLTTDNMLLQASKNKRKELENSIKKGIGIQLECDFCRGLFQARCNCLNSRTSRDFFVVPNADLLIRKNIVVG